MRNIEYKIETLKSLNNDCFKEIPPSSVPSSEDQDKWIIIMKSGTGDVGFDRGWSDYRDGFGHLSGDFWLGLEEMHELTKNDKYRLQVDIQYHDGSWKYAIYDNFRIKCEAEKYELIIGSYNQLSTIRDRLTYHSGSKFSTFDSDNDVCSFNCATDFGSGWWYESCFWTKLTGKQSNIESKDWTGVIWDGSTVKAAEMKIIKFNH